MSTQCGWRYSDLRFFACAALPGPWCWRSQNNLMEPPIKPSPRRIADFAIAGLIIVLAVTVSPIGIRLMTGRLDLSPRITVLSLTFGAFLLVLAGAVPSRGRMKVVLFYLLMLSFPLVALAAIEAVAFAFDIAAQVGPLEELSTLVNVTGLPAQII